MINLNYTVDSNRNSAEGHLKFITNLYNAIKILKRTNKNKSNENEINKYLRSIEKNSPTVRNYLSFNNKDFSPNLPLYIIETEISKSEKAKDKVVTYNNGEFYLISMVKEVSSTIINRYNINNDEKLKKGYC